MKQTESSHTTVQTDTADLQRGRVTKIQSRKGPYRSLIKSIGVLLCLVIIVTVYILAHKKFAHQETVADVLPSAADHALEVEVLDGAGSMKAAQYVTNVLRSKGYDVVEMKKSSDGLIERTYVIDHSGNLNAAKKLAVSLGISQEKVFQKIDRGLYLDITVMVGKDFSRLKMFQGVSERSKH